MKKIDCNPHDRYSIIEYQSFNISSLVCIFGKEVKRFRSNYLDLLFERQDIKVSTFINLFNFSYSNFKLGQNDNIDFSVNFPLKPSFDEQQIPKR